jgi:transposase-like protein
MPKKFSQEDKDTARRLYIEERLGSAEVARRVGCSQPAIQAWKERARAAGDNWDTARANLYRSQEELRARLTSTAEKFSREADALLDKFDTAGPEELAVLEKKSDMLIGLADGNLKMAAMISRLSKPTDTYEVVREAMRAITDYARQHYPALLPVLVEGYAELSGAAMERLKNG